MPGFGDQVSAWVREKQSRMELVRKASVQQAAAEMQQTVANGGRVPHRTGNLLRSILASTAAMPATGPSGARYTGSDPGAVILMAGFEDDIYIGYQANYARRMNYGFVGQDSLGRTYNQSGFHFVEGVRARWPQIVAEQSAILQARSGN